MAVTRTPHRPHDRAEPGRRVAGSASPLRDQVAMLAASILDPAKRNLEWLLRFGVSPSARTILEMKRQESLIEAASPRETGQS